MMGRMKMAMVVIAEKAAMATVAMVAMTSRQQKKEARNIFASSEQKSRQTSFLVPSGFTSLAAVAHSLPLSNC